MVPPKKTGLMRLLDDRKRFLGSRVGLVCNPITVDGKVRHAEDVLAANSDVKLAQLFGPEHGYSANTLRFATVAASRRTVRGSEYPKLSRLEREMRNAAAAISAQRPPSTMPPMPSQSTKMSACSPARSVRRAGS